MKELSTAAQEPATNPRQNLTGSVRDCAKCPIYQASSDSDKCFVAQAVNSVETGLMIGQPSTGLYLFKNAYANNIFEQMSEVLQLPSLLDEGA